MGDVGMYRSMGELVGCGLVEHVNRGTYRVSQKFFNYGKATKWIKSDDTDGVGKRGRRGAEGSGLEAAEGGDVPVPGSDESGSGMQW